MSILSMCVVFIYAQAQTDSTLAAANGSLGNIDNILISNNTVVPALNNNSEESTAADNTNKNTKKDAKKLVKTTASVKAAGASRGSFSATAYCLSGRTAMGHGVRRGLIAADPRVLKLGSRVTVTAGAWSGSYLVSDTGGAIKGKKIDIWVPSCSEARKFGRRNVQISSAQ